MDSSDIAYVRIDKNRKIPLTTFIRALGVGSDEEIFELFGSDDRLAQTILQKDGTKNNSDALIDVYKSCVRANLRQLKARFLISIIFSLTPRDMILPDSEDINSIRS